jgi:hypothetical protein
MEQSQDETTKRMERMEEGIEEGMVNIPLYEDLDEIPALNKSSKEPAYPQLPEIHEEVSRLIHSVPYQP